eukprot:5398550-Pleurochrysis_carterae.AAC.4
MLLDSPASKNTRQIPWSVVCQRCRDSLSILSVRKLRSETRLGGVHRICPSPASRKRQRGSERYLGRSRSKNAHLVTSSRWARSRPHKFLLTLRPPLPRSVTSVYRAWPRALRTIARCARSRAPCRAAAFRRGWSRRASASSACVRVPRGTGRARRP